MLTRFMIAAAVVSTSWRSPVVAQCATETLTPIGAPVDSFHLGTSVAIDGDWIAAGATDLYHDGTVTMYRRTPAGWTPTEELLPDVPQANDFGRSVALRGDRLLVGDPDDLVLAGSAGAVSLFERTPADTWERVETFRPQSLRGGSSLGEIVILGDGIAFASAPRHHLQTDLYFAGAVYVFEEGPTGWSETMLLANDVSTFSTFGFGLAWSGEQLFIGAPGASQPGSARGTVYVYEKGPSGWVEVQRLSELEGHYLFGRAVAAEGDWLFVGAKGVGPLNRGRVYQYERVGGVWEFRGLLPASGNVQGSDYGETFALSNGRLVAGALAGTVGMDRAHIFELGPHGWEETTRLVPAPDEVDDLLGWSVAVGPTEVVLGTPHADNTRDDNVGAVKVLALPAGVVRYCHCDEPGFCDNADRLAGCASSLGFGARLDACGTTSVTADDLVLTATSLVPSMWARLEMGGGASFSPFGAGLGCVTSGAAGVYTFAPHLTGPAGVFVEGPGLAQLTQNQFPPGGAIQAGSTWHFQVVYRDRQATCGGGFSSSNALRATFVP